ncbi:hypothetical protein [Streptomyces sp. NRRL S-350]|uniref:hypothetical protein n=1 Tax=Streptomyces sp. NRRL S-350 TaxID=1463902 RepID=UPI0004C25A2A|nr:hypothetical protein [Streptomyces sp. NRRL S-350]
MFVEVVTHAGGSTPGIAAEAHALMLLRRARQQDAAIEATPEGGARITWSRPAGGGAVAIRSIELTPAATPEPLDATVLPYLAIVATGDAWIESGASGEAIHTFMNSIAPGATARLLARGLVAEYGAHRKVRLTLAGGLGLVAAAHYAEAVKTAARCTCGHVDERGDQQAARLAARAHVREQAAQFVDRLAPAFINAVTVAAR